ncbi:unnamed protein product [Lactuca saligna]|uniref:ATPase AAA-type core domain-containing protein n=1 Tax=Lactuca saligna TaxID=75948 RepID=A0AA36E543_LACSI|nr:unnamed protein product [Lactuca saligna]
MIDNISSLTSSQLNSHLSTTSMMVLSTAEGVDQMELLLNSKGVVARALHLSRGVEKPSGRVTYIVVLERLSRFSVEELNTRGTYTTGRISPIDMTGAEMKQVEQDTNFIVLSTQFIQIAMELILVLEQEIENKCNLNNQVITAHVFSLNFLLNLRWHIAIEEVELDLKAAKERLDGDHYGLVKVKQMIIEYPVVRELKPNAKSQILCFGGPPGVGKTSLASSIATAIGRRFIRISLGGVKDEANIRGHRRTYIGSIPGRLIDGLKVKLM